MAFYSLPFIFGFEYANPNSILCKLARENSSLFFHSNHTQFHDQALSQHSTAPQRELVVAWCNENIDWVVDQMKFFDRISVYSKCHAQLTPSLHSLNSSSSSSPLQKFLLLQQSNPPSLHIETLPNVGVCDHTYLHHITTRWNSLAEWTVFYKGYDESDCPSHTLLPHTSIVKEKGFFCCPGHHSMRREGLSLWREFKMKYHKPAHHRVVPSHGRFETYHGMRGTMGEWVDAMFGRETADRLFEGRKFCFGGYFSVSRSVIQRHSFWVYESMKRQQAHPLEEIDHYIERLWSSLFRSDRIACEGEGVGDWEREEGVIEREYKEEEMEREWREMFKLKKKVDERVMKRRRARLSWVGVALFVFLSFLWLLFVCTLGWFACYFD